MPPIIRPALALLTCVGLLPLQATCGGDQRSQNAEPATVTRHSEKLEQIRKANSLPALWAGRFDLKNHPEFPNRQMTFASGVRKVGSPEQVTLDDQIHLGSCTKAMTAAMVAQQVTAGKLSWTTTLAEALPDCDELAKSDWAEVTLADMLRHRSGIPANAPWWQFANDHRDDAIASRRALAVWLASQKRPSEVKEMYSNVGYALLGHVLESQAKVPWEELARERLFKPLGIQNAGFGPPKGDTEVAQPWGHREKPSIAATFGKLLSTVGGDEKTSAEWAPNQVDNPVPLAPAGRAHMPIGQWAKFVVLFADDTAPTKTLGIAQAEWDALPTTEAGGKMGCGWRIAQRTWADGRVLTHAGSNTSWYCVAWVAPNRNFIALAATNGMHDQAGKACDQAIVEILDLQK